MRYLLLSVLVVCVIGVMVPNVFAETWTMTIAAGAGGDPSCADNDSCVTPSTLTINVGDKIEFISLSKSPMAFRSMDSNNNVDDEFVMSINYNQQLLTTFTKAGIINVMDLYHPWVKFAINVEQKTSSSGAPIHTTEFSKPTIFSKNESTINFGIDLPYYFYDEFLSITGTTNYFIADENVNIKITNTSGNIVYQKEKEVVNSSFKDFVHLGGNSWNQNGVYTITVSYGNETDAILMFDFAKESTRIIKNETYYIQTVTQGKIPIKTELVNLEKLDIERFNIVGTINQKQHLIFNVLPLSDVRAPSEITLEIPRKFLDSKDQFGNDIPFDVSYTVGSGNNKIVRSVIPTEESNDTVRKIIIPFNYIPDQRIVTIHGTHFEGFPYLLENIPELKNTIRLDSTWWTGRLMHNEHPTLHIDSEGNIIILHGQGGEFYQKYNTDGKLLLSSKVTLNLEKASKQYSWFLDSNDNLYVTSIYGIGKSTPVQSTIHKFSNNFKLLKEVSMKEPGSSIRMDITGVDYEDNIWIKYYLNWLSWGSYGAYGCYKISPNLEILEDITNQNCYGIITKNIRDSEGNYYLRTAKDSELAFARNNICKFSPNGNLMTQFSAYGSFSTEHSFNYACANKTPSDLSNDGIFVDSFDNVYVNFGKINGIQKFSPDLQLLMVWNAESMFGKPKHGGTDRFGLSDSLKVIDESGQFYHALANGDRIQIYAQPTIVSEPEPIAEPVAKSEPVSEPVAKSEPVSEPEPTQSSGGCGEGTELVNGVCQLAPTQSKTTSMSIEPLYIIIGVVAIGGIIGAIAVAKRGSGTPKPAREELEEYEEKYLAKEKPVKQKPKPAKQKPVEKKETSAFCENCGNTLNPKAKFCGSCGTPRA